ncbi:sensor histidine kinase [Massilia sp. TWR1-2-2]|uniref:sensor histidine kinase n=1 Tax=Massilia sp. TWR1-2-2 TaxID=2804584 RepID=UPI003CE75761
MISVGRPQHPEVHWEEWGPPLHQFGQATGLTVSVYDAGGIRMVGPLVASRTARFLQASTLWHDDGPGSELEQRIVAAVAASGKAMEDEDFHGLRVCSLPLTQFGKVYGVLVFGWCFRDFSSPMACEQIARLIGAPGHAMWNEVRLETPMSDARMATNVALLRTLAGSIDRQRETIEQLNRVSRTRDLFLATVSHEMRTPLAALSMRVELIIKTHPDLPPAVASGLNAMRVHVRQEAAMVDDLIDAARTLTGQLSVLRAPVTLGRIVRDAVSTIEVNAHEKGISFSVSPLDYGDGIAIAGDARRLQQVLWNLLLNAIKFTPAGGSIQVNISATAGQVRIDVVDSGQGIDEDDLPIVFGAFTLQTHANATGLGLGLYIARRIVELHGGELTVSSGGIGQGSTFTIRLPRELIR